MLTNFCTYLVLNYSTGSVGHAVHRCYTLLKMLKSIWVLYYTPITGSVSAFSTVSSLLSACAANTWEDIFKNKWSHLTDYKAALLNKCLGQYLYLLQKWYVNYFGEEPKTLVWFVTLHIYSFHICFTQLDDLPAILYNGTDIYNHDLQRISRYTLSLSGYVYFKPNLLFSAS